MKEFQEQEHIVKVLVGKKEEIDLNLIYKKKRKNVIEMFKKDMNNI